MLPGVLPPQFGACIVMVYRQKSSINTPVRTTTTTTTTTTTVVFCSRSPFSVRATSCLDTSSWRHGCRLRWDLLRKEEEGATTPLVVATRADVRRSCSGGSSPPLSPKVGAVPYNVDRFLSGPSCRGSGGSAHGGDMSRGGSPPRLRRRWAEPEDRQCGDAARSPEGPRAAGGSHGRVRGCPGAVAGRAAAGRRGR